MLVGGLRELSTVVFVFVVAVSFDTVLAYFATLACQLSFD